MRPEPMKSLSTRLPLLALVLLVAACSGDEPEKPAPGTPKEAVVEYNAALAALDRDRARSWVMPGPVQDEIFNATFGMAEMVEHFRQRVLAVYGEEGLRLLQEEGGAHIDVMETHASQERLASMVFQEVGDIAYGIFPDGNGMRLLRNNGRWKIDMIGSDDPGAADQLRDMLGPQMMLAQILNSAIPMIGKDGMSAEDFDLRLGRYMMTAQTELDRQASELEQEMSAMDAAAPPPAQPAPAQAAPPPATSDGAGPASRPAGGDGTP
jgi:hypothetical protein